MKSFVVVVLLLAVSLGAGQNNKGWWKNAIFYQIYPRSFMDSNNDGIGDLKGIKDRLSHFIESGITAVWLSPINKSPMVDFGYDISDFEDVDPIFGTLQDLKDLIAEAKKQNLKVILDLVPNHTSDQHKWFQLSINRTEKYEDYYIWVNATVNDTGSPIKDKYPNNWVSVFNGTAWTFHEGRGQFYFHQFYKQQPDLNYRNPNVKKEMENIMKFWLDNGIDGFRIDAVPHLYEAANISLNETPFDEKLNLSLHASFNHTLTKDQPETYELVSEWRQFVDTYAKNNNRDEIVLLTEVYSSLSNTVKYYEFGSNVPFNFKFITDANASSTPEQFKTIIDNWIKGTPENNVPNWVMGNHDRVRVGTRYPGRADHMIMLEMILPGVAVTYYGEEIGMEDNTTIFKYDVRDGCRTPFQWDNSINAGFSKANENIVEKEWLPAHTSYKNGLNLEQEKKDSISHYHLYTNLTALRKRDVLRQGNLTTQVLNKNVLAVVRQKETEAVSLLINFSKNSTTVDISNLVNKGNNKIYTSSINSNLIANQLVNPMAIKIPGNVSIIVTSSNGATIVNYSIITFLFVMFISFFQR
ncbi:maltase 1-like [Apis laboriosa]|uniref:maltase 1-like n=1 Tax=Apis laboriosa TaxID=183418 RepID=UPI001CC77B96|nr:maltase 1-like [Apis laboriosa]